MHDFAVVVDRAGGQFAQALPEIEAGTAALQRATAEFSSLATP